MPRGPDPDATNEFFRKAGIVSDSSTQTDTTDGRFRSSVSGLEELFVSSPSVPQRILQRPHFPEHVLQSLLAEVRALLR